MPHIEPHERPQYKLALENLKIQLQGKPRSHVVYVLYVVVRNWLTFRGLPLPNWEARSDACNALHDAETEFRRVWINDYEDFKIKQNGEAK